MEIELKDLQHPQHPWQSWRDRYIKKLKGRPPPSTVLDNGHLTPPLEPTPTTDQQGQLDNEPPGVNEKESFTQADAQILIDNGENIMNIPHEMVKEAWKQWARDDNVC